jgi:hypothetical protein
MCGKSLTFRDALFICTGLCPKDLGHSPKIEETYSGKSKTFRTSGGKAAQRFKPPQNPMWSGDLKFEICLKNGQFIGRISNRTFQSNIPFGG